jgi:uncharacterized protein (DUF849 family)
MLSRKYSEFTEFQRSMFRGGHASARLRNGAEQVSSLLEAAINGSRTRDEHPALPLTAGELAIDVLQCVRAGAGAVHFHVLCETGHETLNNGDLSLALEKMRTVAPGIPLGVSTGAWIVEDPDEWYATVAAWEILPDFASVNLHEKGAEELIRPLLQRNVGVEAGIVDTAAAEVLITSGLAPRCLRILAEPQQQGSKPRAV